MWWEILGVNATGRQVDKWTIPFSQAATRSQVSIPNIHTPTTTDPLFLPGAADISSLQMSLPYKSLCTLERSSIRLCPHYEQILFCTLRTHKKTNSIWQQTSKAQAEYAISKTEPQIVRITNFFFRFGNDFRDFSGTAPLTWKSDIFQSLSTTP